MRITMNLITAINLITASTMRWAGAWHGWNCVMKLKLGIALFWALLICCSLIAMMRQCQTHQSQEKRCLAPLCEGLHPIIRIGAVGRSPLENPKTCLLICSPEWSSMAFEHVIIGLHSGTRTLAQALRSQLRIGLRLSVCVNGGRGWNPGCSNR